MATKRKGLGRGLDALLSGGAKSTAVVKEAIEEAHSPALSSDEQLKYVPVELIQRGKYQPRRDMHPDSLEELAESIKAQGVMQPIVIRPISADKYEIIAGERRWRATQIAGLESIPAVIRDVPDDVHAGLQRRAESAGQSLQQYLSIELARIARHPTLDDVLARIEQREGGRVGFSTAVDDLHDERARA